VAKRVETREIDALVVVRAVVETTREEEARDDEERGEREEVEPSGEP